MHLQAALALRGKVSLDDSQRQGSRRGDTEGDNEAKRRPGTLDKACSVDIGA